LHLGNITFTGSEEAEFDGPEAEESAKNCAELLKVDIQQLK